MTLWKQWSFWEIQSWMKPQAWDMPTHIPTHLAHLPTLHPMQYIYIYLYICLHFFYIINVPKSLIWRWVILYALYCRKVSKIMYRSWGLCVLLCIDAMKCIDFMHTSYNVFVFVVCTVLEWKDLARHGDVLEAWVGVLHDKLLGFD